MNNNERKGKTVLKYHDMKKKVMSRMVRMYRRGEGKKENEKMIEFCTGRWR